MDKHQREKIEDSWQGRAKRATGGNTSRLGLILLAVIGQTPADRPMISIKRGAAIMPDGTVVADCMLRFQMEYRATALGTVQEIVGNFRGLADHLKLSDAERLEMFDLLRKWMGKDLRADTGRREWLKTTEG